MTLEIIFAAAAAGANKRARLIAKLRTLEDTPNIGEEVEGSSLGCLFSECARTGWREYIDFMPGGKVFFSGAYTEVFKDGEIIHYHQTAQMLTPRQLLLVLVAAEKIAAMTAEEEGEQGHE